MTLEKYQGQRPAPVLIQHACRHSCCRRNQQRGWACCNNFVVHSGTHWTWIWMDLASWKLNEEQQADTIIYLLCQHWRVNRRQTLQGWNAAPFDLPTVLGRYGGGSMYGSSMCPCHTIWRPSRVTRGSEGVAHWDGHIVGICMNMLEHFHQEDGLKSNWSGVLYTFHSWTRALSSWMEPCCIGFTRFIPLRIIRILQHQRDTDRRCYALTGLGLADLVCFLQQKVSKSVNIFESLTRWNGATTWIFDGLKVALGKTLKMGSVRTSQVVRYGGYGGYGSGYGSGYGGYGGGYGGMGSMYGGYGGSMYGSSPWWWSSWYLQIWTSHPCCMGHSLSCT